MKTTLLLLLSVLILSLAQPVLAQIPPEASDIELEAPDGTNVHIDRDEYGVPHIKGASETGVFFAQGFATAQDRLFQLEQFRLAALGRVSELDSSLLAQDIRVRTVFYTKEERAQHAAEAREEIRNMLEAYGAGINAFLDSVAANPAAYLPAQFAVLGHTPEPWEMDHSIAIMQFFMRQFGQYGGAELERFRELQQNGMEWFETNRPLNDPDAPTTIPADAPGKMPYRTSDALIGTASSLPWLSADVSPITVVEAPFIPKMGSFAVLVSPEKSATGYVMQLGAPQMHTTADPNPPDVHAIAHEVELNAGELHIGGMTVPGIPGVIIGRNKHVAWTLTSGNSDNTDTFIETVPNGTFDVYLFNGEEVAFEVREETFHPRGGDPVTRPVFRTVHGPVIAENLAQNQVYTWQMTFWNDELDMPSAFYEIWKATNVDEFEAALQEVPMNFNVFYAGKDQNIAYWHIGRLLKNTQEPGAIDPRLPRMGDGTQEWGDDPFIPFSELPQVINPAQGYLVNWNNKPATWWNNGDNAPWVTNAEDREVRTNRVLAIDDYVAPVDSITFAQLQEVVNVVRNANSYPGSYQQVLELAPDSIWGQNLVPPGQSGFINIQGTPARHFVDQWESYLTGVMKPFYFDSPVALADENPGELPHSVELFQNYPNPFNPVTTIRYRLPSAVNVELSVYDVLGRRVAWLVNGLQTAGEHRVEFNAGNLASGLYVYRLQTPTSVLSRTLVIVK
jgi:penicillin amidase